MKNYIRMFVFGGLILLVSCDNTGENNEKTHQEGEKHWSYEGETAPEFWAEIEEDSECGGNRQSPINIIEIDAVANDSATNQLEILYSPNTVLSKVENNGHSIQYDFGAGDSILYNGQAYHLKQIHFHEESEHTLNGIQFPIEIHLVHMNADNDFLVFGIFGMEGDKSQLFEFFESYLPIMNGEEKEINKNVDLATLFPENKDYYTYTGSLTTPPCTENVQWVIFRDPIIISLEEVLKLRDNMPLHNYRNEQALNGRTVYLNRM